MTVETRPVPATEPKVKTVADVLRHAARIIEERGLGQGAYESDAGLCIYGAIALAQQGSSTPRFDDESRQPQFAAYRYIVDTFDVSPIPWNDAPGRTAAEVTAALRAAADAAEAER